MLVEPGCSLVNGGCVLYLERGGDDCIGCAACCLSLSRGGSIGLNKHDGFANSRGLMQVCICGGPLCDVPSYETSVVVRVGSIWLWWCSRGRWGPSSEMMDGYELLDEQSKGQMKEVLVSPSAGFYFTWTMSGVFPGWGCAPSVACAVRGAGKQAQSRVTIDALVCL